MILQQTHFQGREQLCLRREALVPLPDIFTCPPTRSPQASAVVSLRHRCNQTKWLAQGHSRVLPTTLQGIGNLQGVLMWIQSPAFSLPDKDALCPLMLRPYSSGPQHSLALHECPIFLSNKYSQ